MIGTLTKEQSAHILRSGLIGRVGCSNENGVYIVPITYVFDGEYIYAHSREGMKVEIMRKNPMVCFEVDNIENMTNWRCVVIQGKFEELLKQEEQDNALKILKDRLTPYQLSATMRPKGFYEAHEAVEKQRKPVMYRIKINTISGRYEKNNYIDNVPR